MLVIFGIEAGNAEFRTFHVVHRFPGSFPNHFGALEGFVVGGQAVEVSAGEGDTIVVI